MLTLYVPLSTVATMTIHKFWDHVTIVDVKAIGKVLAQNIWLKLGI